MTHTTGAPEHFDVLVVGAGISGISAAWHLQHQCPGKSFVLLESQAGFGGTWRTHRYPGIRSDSDLFTFGYGFKPWMGAPIASAAEKQRCWTVAAKRAGADGQPEEVQITANFLWMCQGYYRHGEGYTPEWPGMDRYQGRLVHPQTWPDDRRPVHARHDAAAFAHLLHHRGRGVFMVAGESIKLPSKMR